MDPDDRTAVDTAIATNRDDTASAPTLSLPAYEIGDAIGRGGMGEVLAAHDGKIGRDVAIKRMTSAEPTTDEIARFLREAKIQARLQHPAIVPVHEIGEDARGRPYFTMKKLAGRTLRDVIAGGSATLQRQLRALVDVCNAVQLAHENGVIHRDLKPSNIMLGAHGEVYVIDWGVARVMTEHETTLDPDRSVASGDTKVGSLLGTAGYMAPEQIEDATRVGPAADVYALGAVLFEILTGGMPLHAGRPLEVIGRTLTETPEPPSQRAPARAIAPELDTLCIEALARDASKRPTARQLGERIEQYLDGDRDLARRRNLAADYLAQARTAAAGAKGDPARHVEAFRLAGRAVGLDPDSEDASAFVASLLLEPPAKDPPALAKKLDDYDRRISLGAVRIASALFFVGFLFFFPLFYWVGVKDWNVIGWLLGMGLATSIVGFIQVKLGRTHDLYALAVVLAFTVAISRLSGPYMIGPTLISGAMINLGQQAQFVKRPPWVLVAMAIVAFSLPVVLEQLGVWERTVTFEGGVMVMRSAALVFEHGDRVHVLVIAASCAILFAGGLLGNTMARERRTLQRDSMRRAWHLENLVRVEAAPRLEDASVRR